MAEMTGLDNLFSKDVLASFITLQKDVARRITEQAVAAYEGRYAQVVRNWKEQGHRIEMPKSPVIGMTFDVTTYVLSPVEIEGYPKPAPWDIPDVPVPVGFGVPIWGSNPVCYSVTGGGSAGDRQMKDGQEYVLVESGQRGTFTFVRMWVPI